MNSCCFFLTSISTALFTQECEFPPRSDCDFVFFFFIFLVMFFSLKNKGWKLKMTPSKNFKEQCDHTLYKQSIYINLLWYRFQRLDMILLHRLNFWIRFEVLFQKWHEVKHNMSFTLTWICLKCDMVVKISSIHTGWFGCLKCARTL